MLFETYAVTFTQLSKLHNMCFMLCVFSLKLCACLLSRGVIQTAQNCELRVTVHRGFVEVSYALKAEKKGAEGEIWDGC